MPPKSKASSGKAKASASEDVFSLQAIVFADSFDRRFGPLTVTTPRCLLPVCNVTLLEWTFECLAAAGVDRIIVICRSHVDQIDAAIKASAWSQEGAGIDISVEKVAKETMSLGDAMRDVYNRKLITSDFLLVHGDLVSNVRVDEVVKIHRERFKASHGSAIMTMILKESGSLHRTRPRGDSAIFVVDPETSECLSYEAFPGIPVKPFASIPREVLEKHAELEIRNDLIDCGIDVCAFEVLSLFEDNFDWQDLRKDFVRDVLTSDILLKNIHCHILPDGYASRVRDTKSYDAVSKDILSRWTFPMVPGDNMPGPSSGYELQRGNTYFAINPPPVLARTAEVGPLSLLGPGVTVAADAKVDYSVLGANCSIGAGTVIRNSYLWDNVVVEAGSVIEHSILGKGVHVREKSTIAQGCLVGDGVDLGPEANLRKLTEVSRRGLRAEDADEDDDDEDGINFEAMEKSQTEDMRKQIGKNSNGIIWPSRKGQEDEEDEDAIASFANLRLGRIGDSASDLELSDDGSITDDEESDYDSSASVLRKRRASASSISSTGETAADRSFLTEAHATLVRAFTEGHAIDACTLELKSLRLSANAPWHLLQEAVVRAVADEVKVVPADQAVQNKEVARVIGRWGPLISNIAASDSVDTIVILQKHCSRPSKSGLFGPLLASLYQNDVLDEDDISAWHKQPTSNPQAAQDEFSQSMRKCWAVGGKLLEHLQASSSDEESESD